jgi:hypothetical protein
LAVTTDELPTGLHQMRAIAEGSAPPAPIQELLGFTRA